MHKDIKYKYISTYIQCILRCIKTKANSMLTRTLILNHAPPSNPESNRVLIVFFCVFSFLGELVSAVPHYRYKLTPTTLPMPEEPFKRKFALALCSSVCWTAFFTAFQQSRSRAAPLLSSQEAERET